MPDQLLLLRGEALPFSTTIDISNFDVEFSDFFVTLYLFSAINPGVLGSYNSCLEDIPTISPDSLKKPWDGDVSGLSQSWAITIFRTLSHATWRKLFFLDVRTRGVMGA